MTFETLIACGLILIAAINAIGNRPEVAGLFWIAAGLFRLVDVIKEKST